MATRIITAGEKHFEAVKYITHTTIDEIYPHFYPKGVINFFHECHNDSNIKQSINAHQVFLLEQDSVFTGTGSIIANEIYRLYILPLYQGKGFGSRLMDFLENKLFDNYSEISLEASLPAYDFYFNRGYRPVQYFKYPTDSGDILCYHVMKRKRKDKGLCD